jgi:glutamine amidotransferase PdxT
MEPPTIGVLSVQGDFREHAAKLRRPGADALELRKPEHPEPSGDTRLHELSLETVKEWNLVRA